MASSLFKQQMRTEFPTILKACEEIAYDNGMVNRDNPESDVYDEMLSRAMKHYSPADFYMFEAQLAALAYDELVDLCTASEGNGEPDLDKFLNTLFEDPE